MINCVYLKHELLYNYTMRRLPVGIQTFRTIIEDDYLYVDKTKDITTLINSGNYYFLSRPRRFGKSLLVSTLKEIFLGNKDLFKGLYIYNKMKWRQHPVIHIDFSVIPHTDSDALTVGFRHFCEKIARAHDVNLSGTAVGDVFYNLIESLSEKYHQKVVVLVDEYDKPIQDVIIDIAQAKKNRDVLRNVFSVLKGADQYLRFVFMTGVSKFSKVSIFSGLNNLLDITLDNRFSTILGITEDEVTTYFSKHIELLAHNQNENIEALKVMIKHWYNGYSWDGTNRVYNPTSLLTLFTKNQFSNYWFSTGTPTFLIELIKKKQYMISQIEEVEVTEEVFDSYDIDYIDITSLLLQAGYLTINKTEKDKLSGITVYTLKYPNFEVHQALLRYAMTAYIDNETALIQPIHIKLIQALIKKDMDHFMTILTSIFAGIPYNLHVKHESYYHSLFYMVLALMGVKIDLEALNDKGRVDGILTLDEQIYIIEFKMGTAEEAMAQIKERKYYEPYLNTDKEVLLLGVGGFADKKLEYRLESLPADK